MTPGHQWKLERLFISESFQGGTLQEAAEAFRRVMPDYDHKQEQAVAVGIDGRRWFACHEAAIADTLHWITSKPYDPTERMDGQRWRTDRNDDGLWSIAP